MCIFYPSLSTCWVERSVALHKNKYDDNKRRQSKTLAHFLKSTINMKIQSQVLTMHASQVTTRERKAPINMSRSRLSIVNIQKASVILVFASRVATLAPKKSLLSLQKFLYIFNSLLSSRNYRLYRNGNFCMSMLSFGNSVRFVRFFVHHLFVFLTCVAISRSIIKRLA